MKITVIYDTADLARLIRQDLARQGIPSTDCEIKCPKGDATVRIEVQPGDEPPAAAPVLTHPPATPRDDAPVERQPPRSPDLRAIEGGADPVDMGDIFRASRHLEKTTEGKFPPAERTLLDGESYDPPEEFR